MPDNGGDPFSDEHTGYDEHLQALRSTVHRPSPSRGRWLIPVVLLLVVAIVAGSYWLLLSPTAPSPSSTTSVDTPLASRVEAALTEAGFDDVTVRVDGDLVTISGSVSDEASLDEAEAAVFSVDGVGSVDNRLLVGSGADVALQDRAEAALAADRYRGVVVSARSGVVVLAGVVATDSDRSQAAATVRAAVPEAKVANRLTVGALPDQPVESTVPVADDVLAARAVEALKNAGYSNMEVAVDRGVVTVEGVVPLGVLEHGFFDYAHQVEATVLAVGDVAGVETKLRLRGDEAALRSQLRQLVDETPIVFESGSAELGDQARQTLDAATQIILSQPGLQVFIAGYTDQVGSSATNEQLAAARAGAVYQYLITKGVPPSRLAVVSYGELFAGSVPSEQARRIEFEVGP